MFSGAIAPTSLAYKEVVFSSSHSLCRRSKPPSSPVVSSDLSPLSSSPSGLWPPPAVEPSAAGLRHHRPRVRIVELDPGIASTSPVNRWSHLVIVSRSNAATPEPHRRRVLVVVIAVVLPPYHVEFCSFGCSRSADQDVRRPFSLSKEDIAKNASCRRPLADQASASTSPTVRPEEGREEEKEEPNRLQWLHMQFSTFRRS
ncbi:hypothetical protein E2562_003123 [Oryza meyeriana var. granulata]|uniref:Uncharacterized protein n=1 Tax=Oryza meyeriana var. granulata TaxID=110450 RepID=A0A6G1EA68_9ORYZ|nr:hypothetical protein E2562_003123 [Oryza meyeriana var. granulata]